MVRKRNKGKESDREGVSRHCQAQSGLEGGGRRQSGRNFEKVDLGKYTFEKIHLLKDLVCDLGKAAVSNLPTMARYLSTIFPPPAEHFYFHQTFVEAIAEKVRVFRLQSIMIRQICKLFVQAWEDLRQRG